MTEPSSDSILPIVAIIISAAAFLLSAIQAIRSYLIDRKTKRRAEYIEFIAVEFGKIDTSLDALAMKLHRAEQQTRINSHEILGDVKQALSVSNRAMTTISNMPAVSKDLVDSSGIDRLDDILTWAGEGVFEGSDRETRISESLGIVSLVHTKCSTIKQEVQSIHLK